MSSHGGSWSGGGVGVALDPPAASTGDAEKVSSIGAALLHFRLTEATIHRAFVHGRLVDGAIWSAFWRIT